MDRGAGGCVDLRRHGALIIDLTADDLTATFLLNDLDGWRRRPEDDAARFSTILRP